MKYIKLFENYKDIESICQKYNIENYTINSDNTVDVNIDVFISEHDLSELPLQFGMVNGLFDCGQNKLTSLKGSPYYVDGDFGVDNNNLSSLEYCPKYIGDCLFLSKNSFYTLDNIDKVVGPIYYNNNPIAELINIFKRDAKLYLEYLEIYNFQNDKTIYKTRFLEALNDFGFTKLPKLNNYIYQ